MCADRRTHDLKSTTDHSKKEGTVFGLNSYLKVWFGKVSCESPKIWISIQVHLNLNLNYFVKTEQTLLPNRLSSIDFHLKMYLCHVHAS